MGREVEVVFTSFTWLNRARKYEPARDCEEEKECMPNGWMSFFYIARVRGCGTEKVGLGLFDHRGDVGSAAAVDVDAAALGIEYRLL